MYDISSTPQHTTMSSLEQILSQSPYTLLYFYPKDDTPGCTMENKDFSSFQDDFYTLGIQLIGVSKDSTESHGKFQQKHSLHIPLISDPQLTLHQQFGARGEKNMYGKKSNGVSRSTFLLNTQGQILQERKGIKATGHAERILIRAKEHQETAFLT